MRKNNYWLTTETGEECTPLVNTTMREHYEAEEGVLPVRYSDKHYYQVDWHWHEEVEFSVVQCEELICEIGNERLVLHRGDCVMINSQVMHQYTPAVEQEKGNLWNSLLFDPKLIAEVDSSVYQEFIEPIIRSSRQYLILDQNVQWQKEIRKRLKEVQDVCVENPPAVDLYLKHLLAGLWILLAEHKELFPACENTSPKQRSRERLRIMMRYIWDHYQEAITLADIARSVHVSERTAERCFKEEIQISPLVFLQNHRLRCARRMLLSEKSSILEIALSCGFESSSYFDRIFKRTYHMTPSQFRQSAL